MSDDEEEGGTVTQEIRRIGPPLDDQEAWRGFDMSTAEKWWNACTGARRREVLILVARQWGTGEHAPGFNGVVDRLVSQLYGDLPKTAKKLVLRYFEREVRTRA